MKRGKRGIACLLAAVLALGGVLPLPSAAAEPTETAETRPAETVSEAPEQELTTEPTQPQVDATIPAVTEQETEPQAEETQPVETQPDETIPEVPTEPEETQETSATEPTEEETLPAEDPALGEEGWMTADYIPEDILPDSTELTDGYAQRLFYGDSGISFYGEAARGQLQSRGAVGMYDILKAGIQQIAAGQRSSTSFEISESQIRSWGVDQFVSFSADDPLGTFLDRLEWKSILDALLHDCPYELYWFDKTSGMAWGAQYRVVNGGYEFTGISTFFRVVADHRTGSYDPNSPTVDTRFAQTAIQASNYAKSIVAANASLPDYEKLAAYRDAICSLVSYNYPAAADDSYYDFDADPWQLIYVFDRDPSTDVVCEGYSKAFQYLCDESRFTGNTRCYTVTGYMNGGGHMWNIVHIGGGNYLTDITNSDDGAKGSNFLFLVGASGSVDSWYIAKDIYYQYSPDTLALWSEQQLTLSNTNYTPGQIVRVPGDMNGDEKVNTDDALHLVLHLSFADRFPLHGDGDLNSDGRVNTDDALHLVLHLSFPDRFPLYP